MSERCKDKDTGMFWVHILLDILKGILGQLIIFPVISVEWRETLLDSKTIVTNEFALFCSIQGRQWKNRKGPLTLIGNKTVL